MTAPSPLSRRAFTRALLAGSTGSIAALGGLNAAIAQKITALNQKFLDDEAPDGVYWEEIRRLYEFEDRFIMMNNGTLGPMPKSVFNTLMRYHRVQVTNPYDGYSILPAVRESLRTKLAAFVGASPEEIAITSNTTEGLNFVIGGLDLKPGDEVLMSTLEHPGHIGPWKLKEKRAGIVIKEVPLSATAKTVDEIVGAFAAAITPKTRIISISHTVFITGLIMPLKELSRLAHDKGLLLLADSAHGIGMLDLDMKALGVDFLASSPYKWLGAPTGVGLLYVRKEAVDKVWPTVVSSGWEANAAASKLDPSGQRSDAALDALGEALDFNTRIGKSRIERRIKVLAARLKQGLAEVPGVKVHTPADPYLSAGLTAFSMGGGLEPKLVDFVREKYNLVVRTTGNAKAGTYGIRVSTPIYVSTKEVDMVVEGVRTLMAHKGRAT
ncbi:MAG TPA: aminotransferase class V-fold PLP-dependent enzyme [Candidatus Aminicenantes bacterium]|nr:aminotransferase class V-fold PLP-dependent enzyme [Candidatus Aminicenantes bacterium]